MSTKINILKNPHGPKSKKSIGRRLVFIGLMLIVGFLLVVTVAASVVAANIATGLRDGEKMLRQAEQNLGRGNTKKAVLAVAAAEQSFVDVARNFNYLKPLKTIPYFTERITNIENILQKSISLSGSITKVMVSVDAIFGVTQQNLGSLEIITNAAPDLKQRFASLSSVQKQAMLASLNSLAEPLKKSAFDMTDARQEIAVLMADPLAGAFKSRLQNLDSQLKNTSEAINLILPILDYLPNILGYQQQKNYLLFFENNTELRPTGGFLGVYGFASIKDAELTEFITDDVYALDVASIGKRPPPPPPIEKYIGVKGWYLRDANWSPDFEVSAKNMTKFWSEEYRDRYKKEPPKIDAVIAITPAVVQNVLRVTGPVTVNGITFTKDNFVDELEYQVEQGFVKKGIAFENRKAIIKDLSLIMIQKISALTLGELVDFTKSFRAVANEKHILVYSDDAQIKNLIKQNNWEGKMLPVRNDYLAVIDANLGALKTDAVMSRQIKYQIRPSKNGFTAKIIATYSNRGKFDWRTTRYRNYLRVYVPQGAKLVSSIGAMENDKTKDPKRRPGKVDVVNDLGRQYFGAFIAVEPGETRSLQFDYELPKNIVDNIKNGNYILDVQKQAGTVAVGLTLDLDFGYMLMGAVPAENRQNWGDQVYNLATDLRQDRSFEVNFK